MDDIDVSTPAGRALLVLGMMTYFILFAMLMGGLYLAIDATAGERERGSLEPLLTVPVARQTLIYGKVLAACCYMLLSLAIALLAFTVALALVPLESLGMTANFDLAVAAKRIPGRGAVRAAGRGAHDGGGLLHAQLSVRRRAISPSCCWCRRCRSCSRASIRCAPSNWLMAVPSLSQHLLITEPVARRAVAGIARVRVDRHDAGRGPAPDVARGPALSARSDPRLAHPAGSSRGSELNSDPILERAISCRNKRRFWSTYARASTS